MYEAIGKRLLDVSVAGLALLVLLPVLLLLAIGARISSPGPAIFRQQRVGLNGELFEFYKFRSMPVDTGDISSDKLGSVQIRPFGKFLRRSNLDELPQLYNVLRGDMSLIGPRPPLPSQLDLLELRKANGAMSCRPGLTGLAQVKSYDGMAVVEKARYDGVYCNEISLMRDVLIVLQTVGYFFRPPPTY